jgi:hypothetical protein
MCRPSGQRSLALTERASGESQEFPATLIRSGRALCRCPADDFGCVSAGVYQMLPMKARYRGNKSTELRFWKPDGENRAEVPEVASAVPRPFRVVERLPAIVTAVISETEEVRLATIMTGAVSRAELSTSKEWPEHDSAQHYQRGTG